MLLLRNNIILRKKQISLLIPYFFINLSAEKNYLHKYVDEKKRSFKVLIQLNSLKSFSVMC